MNPFPDDFSIDCSDQLIHDNILKSEEYRTMVTYITNKYRCNVKLLKSSIIIYLENFNLTVRFVVMNWIKTKFPVIGVPVSYDFRDRESFTTDIKVVNTVDSIDWIYIIPLTKECASSLADYRYTIEKWDNDSLNYVDTNDDTPKDTVKCPDILK